MRTQKTQTPIKESAVYDNFVSQTSTFTRNASARQQTRPSATPQLNRKPEPTLSLKVHLRGEADCQTLAKLLKRTLRSATRDFFFTAKTQYHERNWTFVNRLKPQRASKKKNRDWFYTKHWIGMPEFTQNAIPPFMTFTVKFRTLAQMTAFTYRIKQPISRETKSIWFPRLDPDDNIKKRWIATSPTTLPRYPIYIVSKGRADTRCTSRSLERIGVPYYIAIEPQDYDAYSTVIDKKKILVLPFSNHGDGPGRARNWCWDHATSLNATRHWVLDDNISDFYRLHENQRIRVNDGAIFRAAEDFIDRYENVPIAGFQYRFFIAPNSKYPPLLRIHAFTPAS